MATQSAVTPMGLPSGALFERRPGKITQAPTSPQLLIDSGFRGACVGFAALVVLLVTFIVLRIAMSAVPAMRTYGFDFIRGRVWDPNTERYGILAEIWGTL